MRRGTTRRTEFLVTAKDVRIAQQRQQEYHNESTIAEAISPDQHVVFRATMPTPSRAVSIVVVVVVDGPTPSAIGPVCYSYPTTPSQAPKLLLSFSHHVCPCHPCLQLAHRHHGPKFGSRRAPGARPLQRLQNVSSRCCRRLFTACNTRQRQWAEHAAHAARDGSESYRVHGESESAICEPEEQGAGCDPEGVSATEWTS